MRHDVESVLADGITSGTVLLDLAAGQLADGLSLEGVTEQHGTRDLVSRETARRVVHDHRALRVTSQHDLGVGTLFEGGLDQVGQDRSAVGAEGCVALMVIWCVSFDRGDGSCERD